MHPRNKPADVFIEPIWPDNERDLEVDEHGHLVDKNSKGTAWSAGEKLGEGMEELEWLDKTPFTFAESVLHLANTHLYLEQTTQDWQEKKKREIERFCHSRMQSYKRAIHFARALKLRSDAHRRPTEASVVNTGEITPTNDWRRL